MADFDDKMKDTADNAKNGMGNWKDEGEDRLSGMREDDSETI